jgi:AcrR family transcriptional regulator
MPSSNKPLHNTDAPDESAATAPASPSARTRRGRGEGVSGPDRRAAILDAARRRFAEFGFEATTVRQIADDVSILSGSLYHHFDTKEAMLDEIVRAPVLAMHDETLRIAALPIDAETRLVTLVGAELQALTDHQEQMAIVYSERKFFRRSPYFAYLIKQRKEAYDAWQAILVEGVRGGLFDPAIDTYLTISTIMRMLNTGADWYRNEDGIPQDVLRFYPLEQLLDFYLSLVLRTVRLPSRAGAPIPRPHAEP